MILFLLLKFLVCCDINEIDYLTLFVLKYHIIAFKDQCFILFVICDRFHSVCLDLVCLFLKTKQDISQREVLIWTFFLTFLISFQIGPRAVIDFTKKLFIDRIPISFFNSIRLDFALSLRSEIVLEKILALLIAEPKS